MGWTATGEEGGGVRGSNLSAVVLYPKKALHHWTMNFTESTAWTVYFNILPGCYEEDNKPGGEHWASLDPLVLLLFRFCHCRCYLCPKASSSIFLYWTVRSILIPGQDSFLAPSPHRLPVHLQLECCLACWECHQYCLQCLWAQDLALSVQVQISQMQTEPLALKVSTEAFRTHSAGAICVRKFS